jgi:allantoicase
VFLLAVANLWVTFARSLIPHEIHGMAVGLEVRREKHPGVDDVFILHLDEGDFVVDREVAGLVHRGELIDKNAWSPDITVAEESHHLETSPDFRRMLIAMPLLLGMALMVSRRPGISS